jgi:hypothetical protein
VKGERADGDVGKVEMRRRDSDRQRNLPGSLLRAAYLVAFAKLGYRCAFHPALAIVRDQIVRCDEKILPGFRTILANPVEPSLQMMAIESPQESMASLSSCGGTSCRPRSWVGLLSCEHINDHGRQNPHFQMSGGKISWPLRARSSSGIFRRPSRRGSSSQQAQYSSRQDDTDLAVQDDLSGEESVRVARR